jgi:hypothetical protein
VTTKLKVAKVQVRAVGNFGDFGKWDFLVCRDLNDLIPCLTKMAQAAVAAVPLETAKQTVPNGMIEPEFPIFVRRRDHRHNGGCGSPAISARELGGSGNADDPPSADSQSASAYVRFFICSRQPPVPILSSV